MKDKKMRHRLQWLVGLTGLVALLYACASPGTPDGGPYDETPPVLVKCSPQLFATDNRDKKIHLYFDEFIKLENANEKVVVSPPQTEAPEIKANGKRISVELFDSLRTDMTYTIDFADAIVDNNEGNPLGDFAFTFSTGTTIDTLQVSGTVLDASNLEPVKGMLVGLYANLSDTAFVTLPFERVARTDSRGRFTIRGVAPGNYFIYALQDADQNFMFSQKSEMLAFSHDTIRPSFDFRTRQDTLFVGGDSTMIDTVKEVRYTHFTPDNIVLRAFNEQPTLQYMGKFERPVPHKFSLFFAVPADTLPTVEGLNFAADEAFIIEKTAHNDTITYWLKDSLVYNLDTLAMRVSYLYTDTLGQLVPRTDTLELASKLTRERIRKDAEQKREEWEKELKKKLKRKKDGEVIDTIPPTEFLKSDLKAPSTLELYQNVELTFDEPLARFDTAAIHLQQRVDSVLSDVPFVFRRKEGQLRHYELLAEWQPGREYVMSVDSAAFYGMYGLHTDDMQQAFRVRALEEYAALFLKIPAADTCAVVQLLDGQDKVVRETKISRSSGTADFFFLVPGKYYVRLYYDRNSNGRWDTGLYEESRQAEEVFYYPGVLDLKANWEVEQDWDLHRVPLNEQKPLEITKQKPDKEKTIRNRNAEREREKNR